MLQPRQQSFAAFQPREEERSLPPVQKPAFAAVLASLQLLGPSVQGQLQPLFLALLAADTLGSDEQAVRALQPLVQLCLDHPGASATELKQEVQLHSAKGQLHPLLSGLLGATNPPLLSLLSGAQSAGPRPSYPSTGAGASSSWSCYKCGCTGHLATLVAAPEIIP